MNIGTSIRLRSRERYQWGGHNPNKWEEYATVHRLGRHSFRWTLTRKYALTNVYSGTATTLKQAKAHARFADTHRY